MKVFNLTKYDLRVCVFAKTGTTFMDSMVRRYPEDLSFVTSECIDPDIKTYISVRYPFNRFISGFCTLYYRSAYSSRLDGHPHKELYKEVSKLNLVDAFYKCYDYMHNDWSFDAHTTNILHYIPQDRSNMEFLKYTGIGSFFNQFGYTEPNEDLDHFRNTNPMENKKYLETVIQKDRQTYVDIQEYLKPDLGIFQTLPKLMFST